MPCAWGVLVGFALVVEGEGIDHSSLIFLIKPRTEVRAPRVRQKGPQRRSVLRSLYAYLSAATAPMWREKLGNCIPGRGELRTSLEGYWDSVSAAGREQEASGPSLLLSPLA